MNQATINLRIDADLKKELDSILREMGMNITTAFTIFAKKVARERRIPFEITAPDPFYSEENMKILKSRIADMDAGSNVAAHELIEGKKKRK
jgi:DNA-damage-inducible protein J